MNEYTFKKREQWYTYFLIILNKYTSDSGSSMSSRISPSSSGYKSQRSDATLSATPSPTATPNLHTQVL